MAPPTTTTRLLRRKLNFRHCSPIVDIVRAKLRNKNCDESKMGRKLPAAGVIGNRVRVHSDQLRECANAQKNGEAPRPSARGAPTRPAPPGEAKAERARRAKEHPAAAPRHPAAQKGEDAHSRPATPPKRPPARPQTPRRRRRTTAHPDEQGDARGDRREPRRNPSATKRPPPRTRPPPETRPAFLNSKRKSA